ncbi:MAG: molybdate ABC transporter substrate-binding protein [Gemmatimonadaceae bacterium]|nr:molybdate ABC transporter substrate-binding protein [Gemmatimonadaceae bacterium]
MRFFVRVLMATLLALNAPWTASLAAQTRDEPVVAAAADLSAALPEVVRAFTAHSGRTVKVVFGSSGTFTQQIRNGAPFQLFLSADESYVQLLVSAGKAEGPGALYATGRIGLFLPRGSPIVSDTSLKGFVDAVRRGVITRFAIANPEHAPYGRAAKEVMEQLGIWTLVQPRLVLGENAAQATQFAQSGSTQGGIIPLSLARTPRVRDAGTFVLISASRHKPLQQRMVLLSGAGATARAFYAFLQTREARDILARYGFVLPVPR